MSEFSVIITAAGIGKRMKTTLPKQFLLIHEKPVLMYSLEQFYHFDPKCQIVLTLPEDWVDYWEALCIDFDFTIPHRVVTGGVERYHSIKNALRYCQYDIVAVHDGVRPLVSSETLKRLFDAMRIKNAVIPVVPVVESIRMKSAAQTKAINRDNFVIVQTPQVFKTETLRKAYEIPFHEGITDDATLVEESGESITTVEGNSENIKITNQSDLMYAEMFLK